MRDIKKRIYNRTGIVLIAPGEKIMETSDIVYIPNDKMTLNNEIFDPAFYYTDYSLAINKNINKWVIDSSSGRCEGWVSENNLYTDTNYNRRQNFSGLLSAAGPKGIRPCISVSIGNLDPSNYTISDSELGEKTVITFPFFCYPQNRAEKGIEEYLEKNYQLQNGDVKRENRSFFGGMLFRGFVKNSQIAIENHNEEYSFNGKKYVRVGDAHVLENGKLQSVAYAWFEVEPIEWQICYKTKIQGIDSKLNLISRASLTSLPYCLAEDNFNYLWQNSIIRAYLNGYDLEEEIKINKNGAHYLYKNSILYNFNSGFLDEAFDEERIVKVATLEELKNIANSYGVAISEEPMSIKEQLQFYINSGTSFMLHGPSGVGKTRRVEELDPKLSKLVLRTGILPEEIIGKTAFENGEARWIPPTWYTDICKVCEEDKEHNHILFIDEINNVKPTEQSLVFNLILERAIEGSKGKLPDNCIVVAAGNSLEESESAFNMPEPLFRRFSAHVYLSPNLKEFMVWGSEINKEGRQNIHPLILNFLASQPEALNQKYNPDKPPKYVVDPRGWEQVSNIIYKNNGTLRLKLIEDKIGPDLANGLIDFAKLPCITLEDVINDSYSGEQLQFTDNQKYALTCMFRNVEQENVRAVRLFIGRRFGKEYLALFDSLWSEQDDEKALLIDDLVKEDEVAQKETNDKPDDNSPQDLSQCPF